MGLNEIYNIEDNISTKDFNKISEFVNNKYGLKMPIQKKYLIQCRLRKRLNSLNISTYSEYIDFLFDPKNTSELQNMIDVVTTHKTDFFRENDHFKYITNNILSRSKNYLNRKMNIWSAGCSTGEEPYTLAMTFENFKKTNDTLDYKIFASDVSLDSVNKAVAAIYKLEKTVGIPLEIKKKYFLKNKDPKKNLVRIIPELRNRIEFFVLNLLEDNYNLKHNFDIVMCRNTLIYFSREIQELVLNKITRNIKRDGYLIIGHSESIIGMDLPLKQVKPTIFIKT